MARRRNRRRGDRPGEDASRGPLATRLRRAATAAAALALLAAGALGLWRWASTGDALRIRAIRFQGLARASEAELLALSPVKPGDELLLADLPAAARAMARHPWVEKVEVRRRWPPALEVRVSERVPRALVDLGGLYLVDRDARVFKRAVPGDGLDLPLVTGFTRDDYVQRRADLEPLLAGALALLDTWAAEGLGALPVSEIHVDADEGVTLYVGEEGAQVRLGVGDLPQKCARLRRVLARLGAAGKRAEVIHLDNRNHPSWVTVRLAGLAAGEERRRPLAPRLSVGRGPRGPRDRGVGARAPLAGGTSWRTAETSWSGSTSAPPRSAPSSAR